MDRYVILFFLCLSTPLFSLESFLVFQIQIIYLSSLFLDMQPCSKQLPSNYLKQFSKGKTGIYSSASPRCCLPRFHFSNPLLANQMHYLRAQFPYLCAIGCKLKKYFFNFSKNETKICKNNHKKIKGHNTKTSPNTQLS